MNRDFFYSIPTLLTLFFGAKSEENLSEMKKCKFSLSGLLNMSGLIASADLFKIFETQSKWPSYIIMPRLPANQLQTSFSSRFPA